MEFTPVHLDREEGETLNGFFVPGTKGLILHLHGSYGNFDGNPFVKSLAQVYNDLGWSYASTNNPGFDNNTQQEVFEESYETTVAWIEQLVDSDAPIILQGHSLGALKIIAMARDDRYRSFMKRVVGLVLLSPFDLVAFYGGENVERRRSHAKEFRDANGGDAILPSTIYDIWDISARTYLELSEPDSEYDVFRTRKSDVDALKRIGKPMIVAIGSDDEASYPLPSSVRDILTDNRINNCYIEGAPHNFEGREDDLAKHLEEFVKQFS